MIPTLSRRAVIAYARNLAGIRALHTIARQSGFFIFSFLVLEDIDDYNRFIGDEMNNLLFLALRSVVLLAKFLDYLIREFVLLDEFYREFLHRARPRINIHCLGLLLLVVLPLLLGRLLLRL